MNKASAPIHDIAKACHEANRVYCKSLADFSQKPWLEAPDWQRLSAQNGVRFLLDNPTALPSDSHECWMAEKLAGGWKHGPVKDEALKEHPCLVPYDELSPLQRLKDELFLAIVRSFV